uniref:Uncharacterized protein n=1 Tax=Corvus moneduloides TaxID=1196302 RepID=A0A8C3EUV7_CORMO
MPALKDSGCLQWPITVETAETNKCLDKDLEQTPSFFKEFLQNITRPRNPNHSSACCYIYILLWNSLLQIYKGINEKLLFSHLTYSS